MDEQKTMKDADILANRKVPGRKAKETGMNPQTGTASAPVPEPDGITVPDAAMRQTIVIIPAFNEEKNV
ncbi:MAG: hypothetical protein GY757_26315, partial [bacterium]|nr:hypothetical protein [bacterium]